MKADHWRVLAPLAVGAAIALLPNPGGLSGNAWLYFALFSAVIAALVLEPIPPAAIGFLGITVAAATGLVSSAPSESIRWALSGFANRTVWLIFGAFMLSLGYRKTGLGRRIALYMVKLLGKSTLGLGYAIALADLALAPGTPSNTARSGGTIYPVLCNIPGLYGSEPGPTARRIGSYLMWTAFAATAVTSSMFMTGLAPNPLAVSLVQESLNLDIGWTQWLVGYLPVGVFLLLLLPPLVFLIYPPEIKSSPEVAVWAQEELRKMGRMSLREAEMAAVVVGALALWILARGLFHATTVVLIAISLMLLTGMLNWNDVLGNSPAWNVLIWFATLIALAEGLNRVGFVAWVAGKIAAALAGVQPIAVMVLLVGFFFAAHYMFASITAHTTALLPVILAVGGAVPGLPVLPFSLLLCYSLGLMGVLTPYATGPAPIYFGSGYIGHREFWKLGSLFGLIYLVALLAIGTPYLIWAY